MGALRRLLFVLPAIFAAACQAELPAENVVRVGLAQAPMTLDPRFATDAASQRIQQFLYRGLIRLDGQFRPQLDMAESWTHPSPLRWSFKLKRDIRFHSGEVVRAEDVAATIRSVMARSTGSPLKAGFSAIERIEVTAPDVLDIHLIRPDASLLTRLAIGILPAAMAAQGHNPRMQGGSGAYRLRRWDDNRLSIAPAERERGPEIEFLTVKDPVTRCLKLARGEIDFLQGDIPSHLIPFLHKQDGVEIESVPSTTFSYIGMNLQDAVLRDVRVRRALALALDRKRLKQALLADTPVLAETILTAVHWASTSLPETPYDPARAIRLLDEAGFTPDATGRRFTINYRTSTNPERLRLVTAIADYWRRIGVDVSIESLEWGGFYARIKRGDFQVFSLDWVGITDPDIYSWVLHSEMVPPKGTNRGRYINAEMDAWLQRAEKSESIAERAAIYARVQRKMQEDQVYIPLWYTPVIAVSGPRVRGYTPKADGSLLGLSRITIVR